MRDVSTWGQTGISLREALVAGDALRAAAEVASLDEPHRVELLLGAALRDGRDGFASAALFLDLERAPASADWALLTARLAAPDVDPSLDEHAAALVAARRAPDRYRPEGTSLPRGFSVSVDAVAAALLGGVAGEAILDAFAPSPLTDAVRHYYRRGSLWALGVRPLLVRALVG